MRWWIKLFTSTHILIFKFSGGRLGYKLGKQSILLLNTIGRTSGRKHQTTLSFYRDGENYLLVGSNWGKESHPDWYHNLIQHPQTTIQVGSKNIRVEAHEAKGEEYQRLWQLVSMKNDQYVNYQKDMKRRIPIVILVSIQPN